MTESGPTPFVRQTGKVYKPALPNPTGAWIIRYGWPTWLGLGCCKDGFIKNKVAWDWVNTYHNPNPNPKSNNGTFVHYQDRLAIQYHLVAFVYYQACQRIWVGPAPVRLMGLAVLKLSCSPATDTNFSLWPQTLILNLSHGWKMA